jgi:hypothetical protein
MKLLNVWNYLRYGALFLSSLTFIVILLSGYSYWLMRLSFIVILPVTIPLIFLALVFTISTTISSLVKQKIDFRSIFVWIAVLILSSISFLYRISPLSYEITASDSFENQKYYLIKFFSIDSYHYKLYSCELLSLFCSSSSGYIGIPYQHQPIRLQYNLQTREVYIQNGGEVIKIPD